jgi:hypothetical protein
MPTQSFSRSRRSGIRRRRTLSFVYDFTTRPSKNSVSGAPSRLTSQETSCVKSSITRGLISASSAVSVNKSR